MKKPIIIGLSVILLPSAALALPEGAQIESGSAIVQQLDSATLNIETSDKAVINFSSFNIADGETVNVIQPSSLASALFRDTGGRGSSIAGNLYANGMLFLINTSGIHFTPTSNISVNTLVASTLDIGTNSFMAGNYQLEHKPGSAYAQIINEGRITANNISLVAGAVKNSGVITATAGRVNLASGDKVTVAVDRRGLIQVEINEATSGSVIDLKTGLAVKDAIANSGAIHAHQVIMTAQTADNIFENSINQQGIVRAAKAIEEDGVIRLVASGNISSSHDMVVEGGNIEIFADSDNNGNGSFKQTAGTLTTINSGDIIIQSSGGSTLGNINSAGSLILKQAGSPVIYTQLIDSLITTKNAIDIGLGVTLNANNAVYNIGKDWINLGVFNPQTSSVFLTSPQEAQIIGNNIFYNLEVDEPGKIIRFDTQEPLIIINNLILKGAYGNLINLISLNPPSQWLINPQGQTDIQYALIANCNNIRGPPLKAIHSSSLGNNANLDLDPFWTGQGLSCNWSDSNNWDTGTVPTIFDSVTFDGVTGLNPNKNSVVDSAFSGTIDSLILDGYTGTLTISRDLTLDNFTILTPGTTVIFQSGTLTTINNLLTIEGSIDNHIVLRASLAGEGNEFKIYINAVSDAQGNPYLDYISVSDSIAYGPIIPIPAKHDQIVGRNNTNWDATWTITSTADTNTFGTLRYALNNAASGDTIVFDTGVFPQGSPATITVTSTVLPSITQGNITIDASNAGVIIDGSSLGSGTDGITLASTGNIIMGLKIKSFRRNGIVISSGDNTIGGTGANQGNMIYSNQNLGIYFTASSGTTTILGNYIGTDSTYANLGNSYHGIYVGGQGALTIGGTTSAAANVIAYHTVSYYAGIYIYDGSPIILGNYIGTNSLGANLANSRGIHATTTADSVTIGGTAAGAGNTIRGGTSWAIYLENAAGSTTNIYGNYIGTDSSWRDLGGSEHGIYISSSGAFNIGGTAAGAGNWICFFDVSSMAGIYIYDGSATIQGNYIGTNSSGDNLANTRGIMTASSADNITIGGTSAAAANIIRGGTGGYAFFLTNSSGTTNIYGNYIGTDPSWRDLGGTGTGMRISGTGTFNIGGTEAGMGNWICWFDTSDQTAISIGNGSPTIQGNYIGTNSSGDNLANFYGIYADAGADNVIIGGTAAGAGNIIRGGAGTTLRLYNSSGTTSIQGNYIGTDSSWRDLGGTGYGIYLNGAGTFNIGGTAAGAGNWICFFDTANMTGIYVSDGSATIQGNYIGTNSLGANLANYTGIATYINMDSLNIGGTAAGAGNVIRGGGGAAIDLYASTGSTTNIYGNYIGTDSSWRDLGGSNNGIYIANNGTTNIGGTEAGMGNWICFFDTASRAGIYINYGSLTIQGNYIGTNSSGDNLANYYGIQGVGTFANTFNIGGTSAAAANIIRGGIGYAFYLTNASGSTINIYGNYIGTDSSGRDLGGSSHGIYIDSPATFNIGSATSGAGNWICFFDTANMAGIYVNNGSPTIQGNYIGTNASGADLGNYNGISMAAGADAVTIGGTAAGSSNVISMNDNDGITSASTNTSIVVQGNYIGTNSGGASLPNIGDGIQTTAGTITIGNASEAVSNVIGPNTGYGIYLPSGTPTVSFAGTVTIKDDIYKAAGTFNLGSATLYVSGDFYNSGTINASTSTLILNGTAAQTITSGSRTFNIITVTNSSSGGVVFADRLQCATLNNTTAGSTMKFSAAAVGSPHTVSTTFNVNGSAGNLITLAPQVAATTWYFSPPASTTVTYVSVSYSNSDKIITAQSSYNGGNNNANWVFATTFSGTVYIDEGVTNIGLNKTVAIAVNGAAAAGTDATDANGVYSLTVSGVSDGSIIIVYLDGNTEVGCTVTVTANGSISDLHIYQNHVIVRNDYAAGAGYTTNANLATADNGDTDIKFAVSGSDLTVETGSELFIWSGDIYQPGGNVNVGSTGIKIPGTWAATGTEAIACAGDFNTTGGTFNAASGTLTLSGTSATLTAPSVTFNNLTITGTVSASSSFIINGTLNVNGGSLSASAGTITMATTGWGIANSGTLTFNNLTISETPSTQPSSSFSIGGALTVDNSKTFAPTSGTITMNNGSSVANSGSLTFNNLTIPVSSNVSSSGNFSVAGTFTVNSSDTFTPSATDIISGAGTLTGIGTIKVTRNSPDALNSQYTIATKVLTNLTVDYTGGANQTISNTTYNNLIISGTISTGINTATVTGNFTNSGTFTPSAGTITLAGSGAQTITSGSAVFNTITVTNSSSGGVIFADRLQCTTLNNTTAGSSMKFSAASLASPHTVSTTFNVNGSSGSLITLGPQNAGTTWYFSPPASTTVTYVDVGYSYSDKTITAQESHSGGYNVNWSMGKNISGTVYSDAGITTIGAGRTVAISINGAAASQTTTTYANGTYTLSSVEVNDADVIIVYLDGNTEVGCTVTVVTNEDMSGVDIYQNRAIVRNDYAAGVGYTTNANLATADNGDTDIKFAVSGSDLTVETGSELFIWEGDTYQPEGNVTCFGLDIKGTLIAGTNTVTVETNNLLRFTGTLGQTNPVITVDGYIGTTSSPVILTVSGTSNIHAGGMLDNISVVVEQATGNYSFSEPIPGFVFMNGRPLDHVGQANFRNNIAAGLYNINYYLPAYFWMPAYAFSIPTPDSFARATLRY